MKTAWILIGESNTRKSSVARLLTGVGRIETAVEIADALDRRFQLRAMISVAQEAGYIPQGLLEELNHPGRWQGQLGSIRNALVLLRYRAVDSCRDSKDGRCPDGKECVSALLQAGWHIVCIASLGQRAEDWIRTSGIPYAEFPDSVNVALNELARLVRTSFGWQ